MRLNIVCKEVQASLSRKEHSNPVFVIAKRTREFIMNCTTEQGLESVKRVI